jgi:hypothetical protein
MEVIYINVVAQDGIGIDGFYDIDEEVDKGKYEFDDLEIDYDAMNEIEAMNATANNQGAMNATANNQGAMNATADTEPKSAPLKPDGLDLYLSELKELPVESSLSSDKLLMIQAKKAQALAKLRARQLEKSREEEKLQLEKKKSEEDKIANMIKQSDLFM